ncbi:transglutaminase TgpA family protein [Pseudomarimonas arenosa]|uniref:DUF3488 domain-containing transglutaminase family protein n=1 Tax=Pseudomarimonas arenosa TaxID=2774145 RepID=A0AAW3ZF21_9GAMM|nr:DUF3488 and transglutaminase-like domain-containing protein [Pseudomarimonas arenosa]MBD8524790.1 DUF3488 domain-containing transglutaminase family protein [Pseudomarimonas arenosa]
MRSLAIDRVTSIWCAAAATMAVIPFALLAPPTAQALIAGIFALAVASVALQRPIPRLLRLLLTGIALAAIVWAFELGFGVRNIGRDAASALLTTMLGMKLMELNALRDGRAAAVFSVFAIMAAFLQDQGPATLTLAVIAAIVCLAAMARLAEAESPQSSESATPAENPRQVILRVRSAGILAAVSIPLALVGFFLFPRLAQPIWGMPANSAEARAGLSEDMSPGDIAQLYVDETPVMRVTFNGEIPPPNLRYFRGPVLSNFDGRRWTRGYIANDSPGALRELDGWVEYEVEQEPTERSYLFALDMLGRAPTGARFDWGRALRTRQPMSRLVRHNFRSASSYVFEPEMKRTLNSASQRLPTGFNPRALEIAQRWAAAGDADSVIASALQWFNAEFTYTLEPDLLGRDSVDDFLFETKRGYCEHFSSAFVVLMRAAGIPARVVTGYQGGFVNPLGNYLVIRNSDAHAWAEVWLEGRGWVRVDPTSAVAPERIEQGSQALAPESMLSDYLQPLSNAADWLRRNWNDLVLGYNANRQRQLLRPFGIDQADWQQLAFALIAASSIAIGLTLWVLLRKPPDRRPAVMVAWHRLLDKLARRGYAKPAHRDPAEWVQATFVSEQPIAMQLRDLAGQYETWCYARAPNIDEAALIAALNSFDLRPLPKRRAPVAAA